MATLTRDRFTVWLEPLDAGDPTEHEVTIRHQDYLRGELEHNRQGLPEKGASLNMVTAWCWAAMVREGNYTGPYLQFRDHDCAAVEKLEDTETVDPTQGETPAD